LVVGVIVLFIGMGVQPAFAVTPISVENENDCDLCPSLEDLVYSKDLEDYQGLLDKIYSLQGEDEDLNSNRHPICDLLRPIDIINKIFLTIIADTLEEVYFNQDPSDDFKIFIILPLLALNYLITLPFYILYWGILECDLYS
jgi:hypothetical protein